MTKRVTIIGAGPGGLGAARLQPLDPQWRAFYPGRDGETAPQQCTATPHRTVGNTSSGGQGRAMKGEWEMGVTICRVWSSPPSRLAWP